MEATLHIMENMENGNEELYSTPPPGTEQTNWEPSDTIMD